MKTRYLVLTIALGGILASSAALADHRSGSRSDIARQQRQQASWIHGGVQLGQLTRKEADRLWKQQRRLKEKRQKFLRDGRFSREERRKLRQGYRRAEQKIWRLRGNDRFASRIWNRDRYRVDGDHYSYRRSYPYGWYQD